MMAASKDRPSGVTRNLKAVADLLRDARLVLRDKYAVSRGAIARDSSGNPCTATAADARQWDLVGALQKANTKHDFGVYSEASRLLRRVTDSDNLCRWSDGDEAESVAQRHARIASAIEAALVLLGER